MYHRIGCANIRCEWNIEHKFIIWPIIHTYNSFPTPLHHPLRVKQTQYYTRTRDISFCLSYLMNTLFVKHKRYVCVFLTAIELVEPFAMALWSLSVFAPCYFLIRFHASLTVSTLNVTKPSLHCHNNGFFWLHCSWMIG